MAQLELELDVTREDLQKMRELVVGNEMQRQGSERRMTDTENYWRLLKVDSIPPTPA